MNAAASTAGAPPGPVRILVAEDSPTQAQRLLRILSRQGWDAVLAPNGQEALDQALRQRPGLIISDVVMPVMDGYELTRRVKADAALAETPVILVTTMSDPHDVIRGLECGADSFILKPYDEQHLVGRVQYMLLNRELRRSHDTGMGVEIHFNGQRHYITADRLQILNLLLSTYDAAIQRNQELSTSQDELERTSEEAESANRFLDSVIENIPIALFVTDAHDLKCLRTNRAGEELVGMSREQLAGKTLLDILPPDPAARLEAEFRRVLEHGKVADNTWLELETLEHGHRHFYTRMVPVLDAAGDPVHLLVMCDDVTEKMRAEAELHAANEELVRNAGELRQARLAAEDATRMKSEFLANMSHEIRTPLNAVLGMTQLALKGSLDAQQRDYLDKSLAAGRHLLGVLNDVLDFSKIEAGKLTVDDADFDLAQVLANVGDLLGEKAVSKGLELGIHADPALPTMLRGDPLRLSQVLLNLASNAVKFTEQGTVSIACSLAGEQADSLLLRVTVTDTGPGMSAEQCGRLFSSFQQADASITRRFGGTGLGLVISKRLVALMGGEIGVTSAPGEGSTFWFTVSLKRSAQRTREPAAPGNQPGQARPVGSAPANAPAAGQGHAGLHVLLVEDHPINQKVAAALLALRGVSVQVAGDGKVAVDLLAAAPAGHWDAVFMDMQMPVMDGIAATRAIRQMPQHASLPIIAMTANALADDRARCIAAGMDDHVAKPIEEDVMFAVLDRVVGNARSARVPAPVPAVVAAVPSLEVRAPAASDEAAGRTGPDDAVMRGILADLEALDAAVAHDLRAGIGVIAGYGTLMRQQAGDAHDARLAQHLGSMRDSAQESTALVTAWREASKALRAVPVRRSFDIAAIAAAAARSHAGTARLAFAPAVARACGDPAMVERVWVELLANAVKFARTGEPPRIEAFGELRGAQVVYGVRDGGIGVPADRIESLFRPLQRVHAGDYSGAGLGLFIASRLVARCGGSMWADVPTSWADAGFSVCFTLPAGA